MKGRKAVNGPWKQGIYQISSEATERVGTLREDFDGSKYRYSKAGATALEVGKNTTSPATNADWENVVASAAVAVGGTSVAVTITDPGVDVLPADYFKDGMLQVNDAAGEGHQYRILHSTALTNGGTAVTFTIERPGIIVALTTSSELTPIPSPFMATIESDASSILPATGVPLVAVTAAYYYWSLTSGIGQYWTNSDVGAVGTELILSTDAGELSPNVLASAGSDVTQATVAIVIGTATHIDTEYNSCRYVIE